MLNFLFGAAVAGYLVSVYYNSGKDMAKMTLVLQRDMGAVMERVKELCSKRG